jgi:hypothetical protein
VKNMTAYFRVMLLALRNVIDLPLECQPDREVGILAIVLTELRLWKSH